MKIRWMPGAEKQLDRVQDRTRVEWPGLVEKVTATIHKSVERAARFPDSGRDGRIKGTRELVLTRFPFTVVYGARNGMLVVLALFHHAQSWSEDDLG